MNSVKQSDSNAPLVVIVGQTASGKTALALEIAEKFGGEIICADSRTIYKGMDIGTAKPTSEERARVPHHCLDLINPDETFSAAEFKKCAVRAIGDIASRGKLPIMVGGTGLYIDSVIFDYQFGAAADIEQRNELSRKTIDELQTLIREYGYEMPENSRNKRYLIRAIERRGTVGKRSPLRPNTIVVGLSVSPETIKQRIVARVDTMVAEGFVDEYRLLRMVFPEDAPGFSAPGYKALAGYLDDSSSLVEAKAAFVRNDLHLAKRQRTWFKRNDCIQWVNDRSKAVDIVTTFLNN